MERLNLHLGKMVQTIRKDRKLTAEQLAELCDINATFLRQIEGGHKYPSLSLFVKICNELKVSPNHLLQYDVNTNTWSNIHDLDELFQNASISQQEIILRMLKAALE